MKINDIGILAHCLKFINFTYYDKRTTSESHAFILVVGYINNK